jgi:hypothetical protein
MRSLSFEVVPVIDTMLSLYEKPQSMDRFHEYIATLEGATKGDLTMPIGGFNPMGKEHVYDKLMELKKIEAEDIMAEALEGVNRKFSAAEEKEKIKVVMNLSDDLKGEWTNRYTTDYNSKFRINALVKRKFCTPYFWTSENYSRELVSRRTTEYVLRTLYGMDHEKPKTLGDHVMQEIFVNENSGFVAGALVENDPALQSFYNAHHLSEEEDLIFNFFYGDEASLSLSFRTFGVKGGFPGFRFAEAAVKRSK